jgi:hypothetical protein
VRTDSVGPSSRIFPTICLLKTNLDEPTLYTRPKNLNVQTLAHGLHILPPTQLGQLGKVLRVGPSTPTRSSRHPSALNFDGYKVGNRSWLKFNYRVVFSLRMYKTSIAIFRCTTSTTSLSLSHRIYFSSTVIQFILIKSQTTKLLITSTNRIR